MPPKFDLAITSFRPFDLIVNDLAAFRESYGRSLARLCRRQPQAVLIIDGHDETDLPGKVGVVEVVGL